MALGCIVGVVVSVCVCMHNLGVRKTVPKVKSWERLPTAAKFGMLSPKSGGHKRAGVHRPVP
jgi:hypothetical protein